MGNGDFGAFRWLLGRDCHSGVKMDALSHFSGHFERKNCDLADSGGSEEKSKNSKLSRMRIPRSGDRAMCVRSSRYAPWVQKYLVKI